MKLRQLTCALDVVNDIGSKAFRLQHHSDEEIAAAVKFAREVNGPMFSWLVGVLSDTGAGNQQPSGLRGDPGVPRTASDDTRD